MRSVDVREAEAQLSRLIDEAAAGEPFIIAKAGKPMVKVVAVDQPVPAVKRRLGFLVGTGMEGMASMSLEEFNRDDAEIAALFNAPDPEIEAFFAGSADADE